MDPTAVTSVLGGGSVPRWTEKKKGGDGRRQGYPSLLIRDKNTREQNAAWMAVEITVDANDPLSLSSCF